MGAEGRYAQRKGSAGEEWCIRCANNASSDRSTKGRGVGRRRGVAKSAPTSVNPSEVKRGPPLPPPRRQNPSSARRSHEQLNLTELDLRRQPSAQSAAVQAWLQAHEDGPVSDDDAWCSVE